MGKAWFVLPLLWFAAGCTSTRLKNSTISQAGTLADLQYQQVLNNLAMYCANPETLPSIVSLKDGSAQIADVGSASYVGDWHRAFASHPSILGSRTVVEQWSMGPTVNDIELQVLKLAYRRAAGSEVSLEGDRDLANDLAHELVKQMPDVDDFRGSMAIQYESFRNGERRRQPPGANWQDTIINTIYPVADINEFFETTISVIDEQIVWDEESIALMDIYGSYETYLFKNGSGFQYVRIYSPQDDEIRRRLFPGFQVALWNGKNGLVPYTPLFPAPHKPTVRITAEAADARRQVKETERDLLDIRTDRAWYGRGGKHDVPKHACYVAHHGDCYVWVCPDGLRDLSVLTIKSLKFAGLIKDQSVLTVPGPRFTPASGFPTL